MKLVATVVAVVALTALLSNCKSLSPAAIGDPKRHGFALIEGEAMIHTKVLETGTPDRDYVTRTSDIDAVTLENVARPGSALHGEIRSGQTWFSNLEPGTYRVRDVHVRGDPNEYTHRLPDDADPSALTFSVDAGGLVYLGYVEIFLRPMQNPALPSTTRIALVRNKHEFAAWEEVYDLYAKTKWEPLILKRMAETK
jgi:hypothetical protein